ncbi:MAG TPA: 6,7-dimethyl-8-ribityllumazine synthase [Gammaproteobacteria bacterium]|nr:6,7-dimethyl-8-ribityllumazine synthase [Gammaproteobacteria bacterium]
MNQQYPPTSAAPAEERIAFIQAGWHAEIVGQCRLAFLPALQGAGQAPDSVDVFDVPGAFEIPLQAKRLAATGRYAAIACCGLVVDGGIYRHEFVADAVIRGLMEVQLATDVPVLSAVLTPHHFHGHADHATFFREHFAIKGRELAAACLQTLRNGAALRRMHGSTHPEAARA